MGKKWAGLEERLFFFFPFEIPWIVIQTDSIVSPSGLHKYLRIMSDQDSWLLIHNWHYSCLWQLISSAASFHSATGYLEMQRWPNGTSRTHIRTERFFKRSHLERLCTNIKKEKGQQKKSILSPLFTPCYKNAEVWVCCSIWCLVALSKYLETISEGCGHKPVPFMTSQRVSAGKRAAVNDFVQQYETYVFACHVWRLVISTASLCVVLTTCREKLLSPLLTVWTIYLNSENIRHDWY